MDIQFIDCHLLIRAPSPYAFCPAFVINQVSTGSGSVHGVSILCGWPFVYSCDNTALSQLLSSFIISPDNWQHKFFSFVPQNCLGYSWPFAFPYNVLKISLSRPTNVPRGILVGSLIKPRIKLGRNNIDTIFSILIHEIGYTPPFIKVFFNL